MSAHSHEQAGTPGHPHPHGHGHTHDGIDWAAMIGDLRRDDAMSADADAEIARRLIGPIPADTEPTVLDIGAGAGGQSVAFARELLARGGGRLVIVDAVPELLEAAQQAVKVALDGDDRVRVQTVHADAAAEDFGAGIPAADLVWASRMVHHLPDQQAGAARLAGLLRPGGRLALAEGGLPVRCLPWELGIGAPGLQDRLLALRDAGFAQMRADITGAISMPYGWNVALSRAGLTEVTSFSVLTDHPAPPSQAVRDSVAAWLRGLSERIGDRIGEDDRATLRALLDPAADTYIGAREDIYILGVTTVFLGRR
ncbi:class I SAM-dependent methyltransferase [Nocardia aurantiaca]|uniref:Methyltransferase domain-containing protein n=1 Tax=Nocardia aurantiaca TaxID=2675850 RepID=A0A6I3L411_9NOCA|nr:class I SAM-dependent methyltransferase [Nocardia aurantiaca]MTE14619.1 methyltransferase domain-containing protein [Nocardia aurantiaca]